MKNKLSTTTKNRIGLIGLGVVLGILALALPPAIKFFFRGIHLLMTNPLEALCFFGILTVFSITWIVLEEKEDKKLEKK
jgi:hypothetical protein